MQAGRSVQVHCVFFTRRFDHTAQKKKTINRHTLDTTAWIARPVRMPHKHKLKKARKESKIKQNLFKNETMDLSRCRRMSYHHLYLSGACIRLGGRFS